MSIVNNTFKFQDCPRKIYFASANIIEQGHFQCHLRRHTGKVKGIDSLFIYAFTYLKVLMVRGVHLFESFMA